MKHYILVGYLAINNLFIEDWEDFEDDILTNNNGDIISWNRETDSLTTLLGMLQGWEDFIELSQEQLEDIERNTNIKIEY